jgi:hypothetical protein
MLTDLTEYTVLVIVTFNAVRVSEVTTPAFSGRQPAGF